MSVTQALTHLVGMQAQTANTWYTGLWSRLASFDPDEVSRLLVDRTVVRIALMRSTIHLVTTDDALALRPLLMPAIERPMTGYWRRQLRDLHADEIEAAGRALLEEQPLTAIELGRLMAERWPGSQPSDLAMAVRVWVPLVQTPPRGLWGKSGAARHAPLESWTGRALGPPASLDELVLRYLGAFGPATPADAQAWSGLTKMREVFERLRPQLEVLEDEQGRLLFDLPDAPRPGPDTPAPPRFLYDYDNLMLSHADRTRFVSDQLRAEVLREVGMYSYGSLLVDGFGCGIWRIERGPATRTLVIKLVEPLSQRDHDEVAEEGDALLRFWAPEAEEREVRFERIARPD